jgi:class 3 adenylate cyclase
LSHCIGDAYICTTNLFDDHHGGDVKRAALSALNMAKDMIYSAKDVRIPTKGKGNKRYSLESLQVRVGIHVGEVMCGVLGERLPKFTVLGHSVNVAARMEQTAEANKIRASEAFHDLVSDGDNDWDDYEVIDIKNMGSIGTFTMDPFKVKSWTMPSSKRQPARAGGVLSSSLDLLTSKSS